MPRQKRPHLKRQNDGYFYARFNGKQFKGRTEAEAFGKARAYERELQGEAIRQTRQTVGEYAEYWFPIHKASVKPSTYNVYISILTAAIAPIANIPLNDLTADNVAEALAALNGKSASYIHKARILITEILDSATDTGYIARNPARAQSVKPPKGKKGTHRAITTQERSLIESTPHKMRLAALIMLYCGLRRGELLALRAEDIQADTLPVRRAVYFVGNQPLISEPKTTAGIRTVPAPDFILANLPKMNRGCYVLTGTTKPMTESIFSSCWIAYMNELSRAVNGMQRRWWGRTREHKAMIANGATIPKYKEISIRPHDLRHSYCTWLRDSGVDMHQAIIWMGHADEKLILRIYDHPGHERETAAKNQLFSSLKLRTELRTHESSASDRIE